MKPKKLVLQPKRKRERELRMQEIKQLNSKDVDLKEYLDLTNERLEEQWNLLKSKLGLQ